MTTVSEVAASRYNTVLSLTNLAGAIRFKSRWWLLSQCPEYWIGYWMASHYTHAGYYNSLCERSKK